jgi:hypothetical protein
VKKNIDFSEKKKQGILILLLVWFVTLPLRNSIFTFSLFGIEIYPNFIFTFLLFTTLVPSIKYFSKIQKAILLFLVGWVCLAVLYMLFNGISIEAIFDIHSLVMQFMFAFILFGVLTIFGWDEFKRIIRDGLRFYLILLLVFGFIEFFSLFHIVGSNVSKLVEYPLSSTFFAPFFIYDNNNDYCAYFLLLIGFLYLFDDWLQQRTGIVLLLVFILFFFSRFAQSRLSEYLSYVYFIVLIIIQFKSVLTKKISVRGIFYITSFIFLLSSIFLFNSFFNGSAYLNTPESVINRLIVINQEMDTIVAYKDLPLAKKNKLIKAFSNQKLDDDSRSNGIRVNLLKNGIDMIKKDPVFGAGPGSFRINHKENRFVYPTDTVSNPHNFVIEIVSQFGIFGWAYFGILIFILFRAFKKKFVPSNRKALLILLMILYPFIGLIPSSFLYINLHWLFLPLIVCFVFSSKEIMDTEA